MEVIKIKAAFEDERGSIWDFITDVDIQHVGYLKTKKGSIRGKHYHEKQTQYTLVFRGKIQLISKDLKKGSSVEKTVLNEMDMVCHPPYHYHALEALEDSECLIFTSKGRSGTSYEDDTIRINDIKSFDLK